MSFRMDFCNTPECAAPIIWTTDENDSFVAVDYDSTSEGTVTLVPRNGGRMPISKPAAFPTHPLHTVHRTHV